MGVIWHRCHPVAKNVDNLEANHSTGITVFNYHLKIKQGYPQNSVKPMQDWIILTTIRN